MTRYRVHIFTEMRFSIPNIEAETPEQAAQIAAERDLTQYAPEHCDGVPLSAVVDEAADHSTYVRIIPSAAELISLLCDNIPLIGGAERTLTPQTMAILDGLASGRLVKWPEPDEIFVGAKVFWSDPDDGACSKFGEVNSVDLAEGTAVLTDGTEVLLSELERDDVDKLRQTLEDILEWLKTGMIDDVHYDEASIIDQIEEVLKP